MNFSPEDLLARLGELETAAGKPSRYVIAFSGGLDSTALLHALAEIRQQHGKSLCAVHVDHRLHPDSGNWARHCRRIAERFGVEYECERVEVDLESGLGPEAAAREARYAALARHVDSTDWLLSAHHRDDQAETLLINLLRGSGPAGVAGIPAVRRFVDAWLVRPLLYISHDALRRYASANELDWLDDPSNEESQFDRNYLRNEVMPVIEGRWPDAALRLAKSAALSRESAELLAELADTDLERIATDIGRLDVRTLSELSPERQRNALRRAVDRAGLPPVPSSQMHSIVEQLVPARDDAMPLVEWRGGQARRFQNRLYLLADLPGVDFSGQSLGRESVSLGSGLGSLVLEQTTGDGLSETCIRAGLTLRQRQGGEEIKPLGHKHTRRLKKLLQEEGIVPWMRDRLPLVYSGERLVAVADLWLDADAVVRGGAAIRWQDRPDLY